MKATSLVVSAQIRDLCRNFGAREASEGIAAALIMLTQQSGGSVQHAHDLIDTVSKAVSLSDKRTSSRPAAMKGG